MTLSHHAASFVVSFATLSACGRSQLLVEPPRALVDAATDDVSRAADVVDAPPTSCTWSLGPSVALTAGAEDHALESVVADEHAMLIGWQVSDADPPHDQSWRLQRFGFDGSQQGDAHDALGTPGYHVSYGYISAAYGAGVDAAIAWDEVRGCRFNAITVDGASDGTLVSVSSNLCGSLVGTSGGFSLLTQDLTAHPAWSLHTVDAAGRGVGADVELLPSGTQGPAVRRAVFTDGSFVLLWTDVAPGGFGVYAQRFSATGTPLEGLRDVVAVPTMPMLGRPTTVGSNLVVGWTTGVTATAVVLDDTGAVVTPPVDLPSTRVFATSGVSFAWSQGVILATWADGDAMRATSLRVQPYDTSLHPIGAGLIAEDAFVVAAIRLVPSPDGAVVVYEAEPTPMPVQIFARPVTCGR